MKPETRTGFVYHPDYLKHDPGDWHPERPERLTALVNAVKDSDFWERLVHLNPTPATVEQVEYVHKADYVETLREYCARGGGLMGLDTGVSADSYDTALLAVGGVIKAVSAVMDGEVQNAFAAVRPPGHHAFPESGKGFCLFNNVAIAARYLQKEHGLDRILIVDWDIHHGDGTNYFFYEDPSVFYFSIHEYPFYPGTGRASEDGDGKGKGYTMNIPVSYGTAIEEYLDAFQNKLKPAALDFRPDFVLISAGFDAHKDDPLSGIPLTSSAYGQFTDIIREIADQTCQGRIVSVLEGGYSLSALSESVLEHLEHLS
ncbi:histone deacetylase [Candidatus Poribacteria bacterium]